MPQHFALANSAVMAILSALIGFCYLIGGFNKSATGPASALAPFSSHRIPVGRRHTICGA